MSKFFTCRKKFGMKESSNLVRLPQLDTSTGSSGWNRIYTTSLWLLREFPHGSVAKTPFSPGRWALLIAYRGICRNY